MGVKKAFVKKIPSELISDKMGNSKVINMTSAEEPLYQDGGWIYYVDSAEIQINIDKPLNRKWGEYEGHRPIDW